MSRTIKEVNNTRTVRVTGDYIHSDKPAETFYTINREESDGRTRFALITWTAGNAHEAITVSAIETRIDLLTDRVRWHRIRAELESTGIAAGWVFASRAQFNREEWRDQRNDFLFGGRV